MEGMEESICFPLPPLVAVVLERIREEQLEEAILVVPWWTNKYWFRVLKTMIRSVRRLRLQEDLVVDPMTGPLPRLKDLKLVMCSVCGGARRATVGHSSRMYLGGMETRDPGQVWRSVVELLELAATWWNLANYRSCSLVG